MGTRRYDAPSDTYGVPMKRIGVDVGGTFTDLYYSDDTRAVVEKVRPRQRTPQPGTPAVSP
jgi:N-methylhydantoinase A/oxoprolinase/acetone carboxylase beta subunit